MGWYGIQAIKPVNDNMMKHEIKGNLCEDDT